MKKFIKSIPVYLTVVILLCSLLVVPAFASSDVQIIEPYSVTEGSVYLIGGAEIEAENCSYTWYLLPAGTYSVEYGSFDGVSIDGFSLDGVVINCDIVELNDEAIAISENGVFTITENMLRTGLEDFMPEAEGLCVVMVNSYLTEPVVSVYNEPVIDTPSGESPVVSILDVWAKILAWMAEAFDRLSLVFYSADTGLTFIGYLAVGALAVAVVLLLLGLVRKWLRFGR